MPDESQTPTPAEVKRVERDLQAMTLRKTGYSFHEIGAFFEITAGAARLMICRILDEHRNELSETTEQVRMMELLRLDDLTMAVWPRAMLGDDKAVDRVLAIMVRRAKLTGSDGPKKVEHSGEMFIREYRGVNTDDV